MSDKKQKMPQEIVLCGANAYNEKFYLDERFEKLPKEVKEELKVMCVLFCTEIGGIFQLVFDAEGNLKFCTSHEENDFFYDEIGCGLKIKQLQQKHEKLLLGLELYYKVIFGKIEV